MAEEAQEEKAKSPMMMIIIIAVVCILGSLGGAYFMFGGSSDAEATPEGEEVAEEAEEPKKAFYFSLDPAFVVNFQGKSRARYLQVNIEGMTRDEKVKIDITTHLPQLRNNAVMILSSQTYEDLITPEGKEALRVTLLEDMQKVLENETGKPGIENIYFTNFVMQ